MDQQHQQQMLFKQSYGAPGGGSGFGGSSLNFTGLGGNGGIDNYSGKGYLNANGSYNNFDKSSGGKQRSLRLHRDDIAS
jgi:hypothetical protein